MQPIGGTYSRRLMQSHLPVIQDHIGALHELHSPQREQAGIAWSSADQVHIARAALLPYARKRPSMSNSTASTAQVGQLGHDVGGFCATNCAPDPARLACSRLSSCAAPTELPDHWLSTCLCAKLLLTTSR